MRAAQGFKDECDSIAAILADKTDADFETATLFKDWTINDIIGHLHLWNEAAYLCLTDEPAFYQFLGKAIVPLGEGKSHPDIQNDIFSDLKNLALFEAWRDYYPKLFQAYKEADPERRVKWAGPDMSAESCIIARQMEHWAHAQAIFDVLGLDRIDTDRIKNIAHLGVITYSWSFKVKDMEPPRPKPYVKLTAPSGEIWAWNDPQDDNRVEGSATEFCQVVTQCRNEADTSLSTIGETAKLWMETAQCFAGGAETPPAEGERRKAV